MNQQNPDVTLGDTTPPAPSAPASAAPIGLPAGGAFGDPYTPSSIELPEWTIDDILAMAHLPEKRARVCLRGDLQARRDQLVADLSGLIDVEGKVIEDPERSAGEVSNAARAQALADELTQVEAEMRKAMWFPLFRGMSSDDFAVFNKKHFPKPDKNGEADMSDYNTQLIAACSVDPAMSVDDVKALRKKLGSKAIQALRETAQEVCTKGGVDVPKSPASLLNLARQ